jgi:hypothetical protein
VQRDQTALAELGVADDQSLGRDVVKLKGQSLGDPQAGAREQRKERHVGLGTQRPRWTKPACGFENLADLFGREDVRNSASSGKSSERAGWRHFVAPILSLHPQGETPHHCDAVSPLFDRGCLLRPSEHGLGADDIVSARLGEPSKVPKQAFL